MEENFLQYERFLFTLKLTSFMLLPPYKGGIFHSGFGAAFRKIVCAARHNKCDSCILNPKCLYISLFKPAPPVDYPDADKYSSAPPPYVLNPPLTNRQTFHPQELMTFDLVLLGRAIDALPYFIYAFQELGQQGLGRERGKYELHQVALSNGERMIPVYDGNEGVIKSYNYHPAPLLSGKTEKIEQVTIEFLTPLRLKEKNRLVRPGQLTFPLLFARLEHRLTLLTRFYGSISGLPDPARLSDQSRVIEVFSDELFWYEWERYSATQKSAMKLGGLRGKIVFQGELAPYLPYLQIGEQINIGQEASSFGLGRYKVILS